MSDPVVVEQEGFEWFEPIELDVEQVEGLFDELGERLREVTGRRLLVSPEWSDVVGSTRSAVEHVSQQALSRMMGRPLGVRDLVTVAEIVGMHRSLHALHETLGEVRR